MAFPDVKLKPGPKILAASLKRAGFSDTKRLPGVTDACGVIWIPTELQIMLAVVGGESSGHAWCWHVNADGSTDYGAAEINNRFHPEYFGAVKDPAQLNWANYDQNCQMAYLVYLSAGQKFTPWHAYSGGGYLANRANNKSWMTWAAFGVHQMQVSVSALMKAGRTQAKALAAVASLDNDPINYGV